MRKCERESFMLPRTICIMAMAAITGTLFTSSAAEAGSRWSLHFLQPRYYTYYPRPIDLYSSDYGDDEDYADDPAPLAYYDPQDSYYAPKYRGQDDGSKYQGQDGEPVYIIPKKKKTAKIVPLAKPVVEKSVASTEKKPVVSTGKLAVPGATDMTCDNAGKIVSGYGFTSVKPTSCAGQVFAFNATRNGKSYVIKLSSASGELTEVKKVQ